MDPIIIILGLIGGIVIFINPIVGLLTTIALIPQSIIPSMSSTIFGIFTVATPIKIIGGITFVSVFIKQLLERKRLNFIKKHQLKYFIIFLLWIIISGFSQPGSFTRENFTLFTSFAMLGFIILVLIINKKRFKLALWVGLISTFAVAIHEFIYYAYSNKTISVSGASYGSGYFAIGLIPFIGIAFYNSFTEKNKLLTIFSLIISAIIASTLILTFSRGGILGFAGLLLIGMLKSNNKFKSFIFFIVFGLLLVSVMPPRVWEKFEKTKINVPSSDQVVQSTQLRWIHINIAWRIFLEHPLNGIGIGNYYWECGKYAPIGHGRAHNTYLEILAELGIIGLFIFAGILFYTFKTLENIIQSQHEAYSGYAKGLYTGLAGFLIAALFLHAQQEKVLWFVIFMAMALENVWEKEKTGLRVGELSGSRVNKARLRNNSHKSQVTR